MTQGLSDDEPARCSAATLRLARDDFARSGLTLADAEAVGMFAVDDASSVHPDFAKARGIIIPYRSRTGEPMTYNRNGAPVPICRVRYLVPPGFLLPRNRRYDTPHDSGTAPWLPPCFDWAAFERGEVSPIVIVEGAKKALALCRAGVPTVALDGVFNFGDGSAPLHPELAHLAACCPDIRIVFDSDAATNPKIQIAEWRLAGQLALAGTVPHVVRVPTDGPEKVGADDYLLKYGRGALVKLILSAPPLGNVARTDHDAGTFSISEILARSVTPVAELIPGWLEKGIPTFLCGPGGVHKSRLALQWGLCLSAGAPVWGMGAQLHGLKPSCPVTLVYCAAEDDADELARRAQAIRTTLKLKGPFKGELVSRKATDSALAIMHEDARADIRPFYHSLRQRLRNVSGHKLLVLDSAYDFVRFAGRAKISEDAVNYFIKVVLQGICDQTDSTMLIPWHPSQAGSEREATDGWSVAWHNAPRARLSLKSAKGIEDTYELVVAKRNHGRTGAQMALRFYEGALLPVDAVPDDGKATGIHKACVDGAIEAARAGVPFTRQKNVAAPIVAEISKKAGALLTPKRIKDELEAAAFNRELTYRPGYGKIRAGYILPEPLINGEGGSA